VCPRESINQDENSASAPSDPEQILLEALQLSLNRGCHPKPPDQSSEEAWEAFAEEYAQLIETVVRRYLRNDCDCLDCTQDVWLVILAKIPRFHLDSSRGRFRGWLTVLIYHAVADHLRQLNRLAIEHAGIVPEEGLRGREPDPAEVYERQEQVTEIQQLLKTLQGRVSSSSYRAFQLRYLEERSVGEIALLLETTPKRVRDRLARVKRIFQDLLVGAVLPPDRSSCDG
jgi:RNA polymerase sigma factor (sigma-70 family)